MTRGEGPGLGGHPATDLSRGVAPQHRTWGAALPDTTWVSPRGLLVGLLIWALSTTAAARTLHGPALWLLGGALLLALLLVFRRWRSQWLALPPLLLLLLAAPLAPGAVEPVAYVTLWLLGTRLGAAGLGTAGRGAALLRFWTLPASLLLTLALGGWSWPPSIRMLGLLLSLLAVVVGAASFARLRASRDESHQLAAQLQQANAELRQQALQSAELSRLQERERLARDLHDTLGHALSTLTVQLEAARRLQARDLQAHGLQARDLGAADAQLQQAQGLSRQAMRDLRAALDDLRADPLTDTGGPPDLEALICALAEPLARQHGWHLLVEAALPPGLLSPQLVLALRPVLAETLMNAARHAGAAEVRVTAALTPGPCLLLKVQDDGVGLGTSAREQESGEQRGRYGLRGLRERVEALGGAVQVRGGTVQVRDGAVQGGEAGGVMRGTVIEVQVPLQAGPPLQTGPGVSA